jgi:hypothetical protein
MSDSRPILLLSLVGLLAPGTAWADDKAAAREPVARYLTENALLLRRASADAPWQLTTPKTTLFSGDLVMGGGGQAIESLNGAVRLTLRGDWNGLSPYPIVETAVRLRAGTAADLELTLDRGQIDLTNLKRNGPARVRIHAGGKHGDVVLADPGSRVCLEIYGRWPAGTRFQRDEGSTGAPAFAFVVVALKGKVDLVSDTRRVALQAPPGPALLLGDGITDTDPSPQHLDKLPEWVREGAVTEQGKAVQATMAKLRRLGQEKGINAALDELLRSDDPTDRRVAVHGLAALDDLTRLGQALRASKNLDVWENAILALRHWVGRAPGQDRKLYQKLVEVGFPEAEAEIVLNLLYGFSESDRKQPETYEALLDYLESDRPAIRCLGHWHLVRLVPAGKAIGYNPLAAEAERERAVKEWRKLLPQGQLPGGRVGPSK